MDKVTIVILKNRSYQVRKETKLKLSANEMNVFLGHGGRNKVEK